MAEPLTRRRDRLGRGSESLIWELRGEMREVNLGGFSGGHLLHSLFCWENTTGSFVSEEKAVVLVVG